LASLYQRALVIQRSQPRVWSQSFIATLVNGLGRAYDQQGDFAHAEPLLYKRALAIEEKVSGRKT